MCCMTKKELITYLHFNALAWLENMDEHPSNPRTLFYLLCDLKEAGYIEGVKPEFYLSAFNYVTHFWTVKLQDETFVLGLQVEMNKLAYFYDEEPYMKESLYCFFEAELPTDVFDDIAVWGIKIIRQLKPLTDEEHFNCLRKYRSLFFPGKYSKPC